MVNGQEWNERSNPVPVEITPEKPIRITQAEHERLAAQWRASLRMTTQPVSFEVWLRARRGKPLDETLGAFLHL